MSATRRPAEPVHQATRQRKADLRATLVAARTRRDGYQRSLAAVALARWAEALAATTVTAGFVGVGTEPPTLPLLKALRDRGVRVLLPVIRPERVLDWAELEGPLGVGPLGLSEPVGRRLGPDAVRQAGLVVVPALAVDRAGHRIGRGAGYYDRALASLAPGVRVVAVVFDDEVLDAVPVEPHDRPVHGVLTPAGLTMFDDEEGGNTVAHE